MTKPVRSPWLWASLVAGTALLTACGENKNTTESVAHDAATTAKDIAADIKNAAVTTWDQIKSFTFEKKNEFADGIDRLAQATDKQVSALPDKTSAARAAAIAEYQEARVELQAQLGKLRETSADTWDATKAKTAAVWQRVQDAYQKVKDSPEP